jgi:Mrp family chromosome partitioning ATPase
MAEAALSEAEKLIVYLLDDFYLELEPVGRLDIVAALAKRAVDYYGALPPELRTTETDRNRSLALVRYGSALRIQSKLDESQKALSEAVDVLSKLRAQGDQSEATAIGLGMGLWGEARVASSKGEGLSSMLDQLKRQAASTNEQDVQLRALERDAKLQRDLLESYLAKYREASARDSIGAAAPDARIISAASVSNTPSWPKKVPIILVAALAMFTLSSAFVVTGELLRTLPMQGSAAIPTPVAARSPVRSEPAQASDVISPARTAAALRTPPGPRKEGGEIEGIEALARELIDAGEGARRVTVIGALRNVGTTRTAIALARSLAGRSRVVLVELAAASRNLSAIANDPSVPGLAELVEGSASFGDIITRDRHSRAHLIMAGRAAIEPVALVNSQRLSIAIEALGRSYDHVIIDAGVVERELLDRFAMFAPRAVLVAPDTDGPVTVETRERLLQSGFADVNVIVTAPSDPGVAGAGAKAAA